MEVINKKHDEILVNKRVVLEAFMNVLDKKHFYFSAGASRKFGLKAGLNVHFLNDERVWMFYCNNDEDGFDLIERKNKNAVLICNAALIHLFLKQTSCTIPCKFGLRSTNAKHQGNHLIKIETNKPL